MIFILQGRQYEVDQERLSVQEATRIKRVTGLTVRGFLNGLKEYDPDAIVALVWLAKQRNGERVSIEDVAASNFDLLQDFDAVEDPAVDAEDEDAEADPTAGLGAPETNGSTLTSPPSTPSTPTSTGRTGSARSRSTSATPPHK